MMEDNLNVCMYVCMCVCVYVCMCMCYVDHMISCSPVVILHDYVDLETYVEFFCRTVTNIMIIPNATVKIA